MPRYDTTSDPPAPFARVTVRRRDAPKSVTDVVMLLDTGADTTLVPKIVVEALNIDVFAAPGIRLVGYDGSVNTSLAADMELEFAGRKFSGEFLVVEGNYGILGRDLLNLMRIVFDGPNLRWDIVP